MDSDQSQPGHGRDRHHEDNRAAANPPKFFRADEVIQNRVQSIAAMVKGRKYESRIDQFDPRILQALHHLASVLGDLRPQVHEKEMSGDELMPKSIGLQNPEKVSLFVAGPTLFTEKVFKPAIWALNGAGNGLLRLIGVQPAPSHLQVHSAAELRMLVTASTQGGVLHADEGQLLHAAINFGDLVVRQVMVPRTEILAVESRYPAGRYYQPCK